MVSELGILAKCLFSSFRRKTTVDTMTTGRYSTVSATHGRIVAYERRYDNNSWIFYEISQFSLSLYQIQDYNVPGVSKCDFIHGRKKTNF